jgi:hypothetical protein
LFLSEDEDVELRNRFEVAREDQKTILFTCGIPINRASRRGSETPDIYTGAVYPNSKPTGADRMIALASNGDGRKKMRSRSRFAEEVERLCTIGP